MHGWAVPDARVVMTHSGYYPRQSHAHATFDKAMSSTAQDFRSLTRLVLAEALVRAGTVVCAPVHRFELEVPEDTLGSVLGELEPAPGRAAGDDPARSRRPCSSARCRPTRSTACSSGSRT